jgi:phenylpyruvate tautomerase PptA (4-oxalocrotonate tautomerase family)
MAQTKIYGFRSHLEPIRSQLSDVIHSCVVEALQYPVNKRAHRFIMLDQGDFFCPDGRTEKYTIIEFSMIEGRTTETKKKLIRLLSERIPKTVGITPHDLEFTIFETPAHNWGFRGLPGDEHMLDYKIRI